MPRVREEEKGITERERNLRAYKRITAVSNAASNVCIRHRLRTVSRYLLLGVPGIFYQALWPAARNINRKDNTYLCMYYIHLLYTFIYLFLLYIKIADISYKSEKLVIYNSHNNHYLIRSFNEM